MTWDLKNKINETCFSGKASSLWWWVDSCGTEYFEGSYSDLQTIVGYISVGDQTG